MKNEAKEFVLLEMILWNALLTFIILSEAKIELINSMFWSMVQLQRL